MHTMRTFSFRLVQFVVLSGCLLLSACKMFNSNIATQKSDEPRLLLQIDAQQSVLTRSALLHFPNVQSITVLDDVSYHRQQTYQALPLKSLLASLALQGSLQFTALDGFVATIPNQLVLADGDVAQAWLAVEDPTQPWDALKAGQASAGPFYLVWLSPEKSHISGEQWPYQIAKISSSVPLEVRYPQLQPHAKGEQQISASRGLQVFTKNCATCHSLNKGGDAKIGPDLNLPMNPSEYFQASALRRLIREPGSVRLWQQSTMPGFKSDMISEAELDDLLVYLQQMAAQRQ